MTDESAGRSRKMNNATHMGVAIGHLNLIDEDELADELGYDVPLSNLIEQLERIKEELARPEDQFVHATVCREMRKYARQGHFCTKIGVHLLDEEYGSDTVSHHAFGRCTHHPDQVGEPATPTGRGTKEWSA